MQESGHLRYTTLTVGPERVCTSSVSVAILSIDRIMLRLNTLVPILLPWLGVLVSCANTVCTLATPLLRQLTDHGYLDSLTHQWLPRRYSGFLDALRYK
jgi:hypothetical protein